MQILSVLMHSASARVFVLNLLSVLYLIEIYFPFCFCFFCLLLMKTIFFASFTFQHSNSVLVECAKL